MKYYIPATAKASDLAKIPFFWKNDQDDSVVLLGFVQGEGELPGLNARLCQLCKQRGCTTDAPVQLKLWGERMGRLCALADGRLGVKEGEFGDGAVTCVYYELPARLEDVQALVPPGATNPADIFTKV